MSDRMAALTPTVVEAIWQAFHAAHRSRRVPKAHSWLMRVSARLLSWRGMMTRAVFMGQFATTIGRTIYMPDNMPSALHQLVLCVHEHEHVAQWGWRYALRYLCSSHWRAHYEAEAYAAGMALRYWLLDAGAITYEWPLKIADQIRTHYGCDTGDHAATYVRLRTEVMLLEAGRCSSPRVIEAIHYLEGAGITSGNILRLEEAPAS